MKALLEQCSNYQETFGESRAFECTIANEDYFVFFTREPEPEWMADKKGYSYNDGDVDKRLIAYDRTQPTIDSQLELLSGHVEGFSFPHIDMTYTPLEQVIGCDGGNGVLSIGSGHKALVLTEMVRGARKCRTIGNKIYLAKARRRVVYRVGENQWQTLGNDISLSTDNTAKTLIAVGFNDVDGFDENHIYAVGGHGDVWRCIDGKWIQCGFPTNLGLDVVCCAGDGKVYIGGVGGVVYVGIEDSWRKVDKSGAPLQYSDMVWHNDKVWCSNDYGIWWIKEGKFERADVPTGVIVRAGRLCARFDKLLVAGYGGAALHEYGKWTLLF